MESVITFIVMWCVGVVLNPMNMLVYKWEHLRISVKLIYIGFFMASNMLWVHSILHYIFGHSSIKDTMTTISIGITLALFAVFLMRH